MHIRVLAALLSIGFVPICGATPAAAQTHQASAVQLPAGTPIKLMVTKEVNSRSAKPGDRFKLRVDEAVVIDGATKIPIGTTAWGEITSAEGTDVAGGKGRLFAKLLYVDMADGQLPVTGTKAAEGKSNTTGVVLGVLSFGVFGLLNKGGNANLKAGDILIGYAADVGTAEGSPGAPTVR